MIIEISESGMNFIVEEDNTFQIEKDKNVNSHFKSVEFIELVNTDVNKAKAEYIEAKGKPYSLELKERKQNGVLHFVEAKKSNPKQYVTANIHDHDSAEKYNKYNEYFHDIREKFQNSVSIYFSSMFGRSGTEKRYKAFPESIKASKAKTIDCKLFLIVKDAQETWLIHIKERLTKELKPLLKCWNIADANLKVLTENEARNQHLII